MFENLNEQKRKKIFWLIILNITAIIFIIWLILFAKGYILGTNKKESNNSNQPSFQQMKSELSGTLDEFRNLNFKEKINDLKNEYNNLQNQNTNQNLSNIQDNDNQPVNEQTNNESTNQPETENLNTNSSLPRLPVEN